MPLPYGQDLANSYNMGAAYQQAAEFLRRLMSGPQGQSSNMMRQISANIANQLGGLDANYDDSWVKNWLGYGNDNNSLRVLQQQMQYAQQRAQNRGEDVNAGWMPTLGAVGQGATPTMAQRNFALDWGRAMGENISPEQEALVRSYVSGTSPLMQSLQRQYVADLYDRSREFRPEYITAQGPGGVATADQYLRDLNWQMQRDQILGQTYDPTSGGYQTSAAVLYNNLRQILQALYAGGGNIAQLLGDAFNSARSDIFGGINNMRQQGDQNLDSILFSQPGSTRKPSFREADTQSMEPYNGSYVPQPEDNDAFKLWKATETKTTKSRFLGDLERAYRNKEISAYVYRELKRWAGEPGRKFMREKGRP